MKRSLIFLLFPILSFIYSPALLSQDFLNTEIVTVNARVKSDSVRAGQTIELILEVKIAVGWHINAHKPLEEFLIPTNLELDSTANVEVVKVNYPTPDEINFAFSEKPVLVYDDDVIISATLKLPEKLSAGQPVLKGKLTFQGCNDQTCLAPDAKTFSVTYSIVDSKGTEKSEAPDQQGNLQLDKPADSQNFSADELYAKNLLDKGFFYAAIAFFLFGLGLNLTPCVYPVIPMTVTFFGAQAKEKKGSNFWIAFFYLIGIAIVFAVLGLVSSLAGKQWGFLFQNPWFVVIIVLILLAMSASMFGAFEIQLPSRLMTSLGQSRKGILGALLMGLTVGVVIAPCAAGIIIGLVGLVAKLGLVVEGTILFFIMGLGLGLPYFILANLSGLLTRLPKSGLWMVWIRKLFGILLIGVAFYFLVPQVSRMVDQQSFYFGLTALFGGLYLGFLDTDHSYKVKFNRFRAVFGIVLIILGGFWINKAIASTESNSGMVQATELIKWNHYSENNPIAYQTSAKPVIFDFYADWCAPCKKMNQTTFRDSTLVQKSLDFTMIKVDCTNPDRAVSQLMKEYQVVGMPTLVFLDKSGAEKTELRAVQYVGPEDFLFKMKQIIP